MTDDRNPINAMSMLLAVLLLLAAFVLTVPELDSQSLAYDEGWTMWAIRETLPTATVARVADDVHPPLYFLLLDLWSALTGESVFAIRALSAFIALIGLATTYAIGKIMFDRWVGLFSLVVLMTASFFVYYAREARMYSLLLMLAALTTWAYLRWLQKPTRANTWQYGLWMTLLMYTHYAGVFIIVTHLIHLLLAHPLHIRRPRPYLIALLFYVPWISAVVHQVRLHPDGSLAQSLPTDLNTLAALLLVMTSARWWLLLLPIVLGRGLLRLRVHYRQTLLVVLWLVITPVALFLANLMFPLYQQRYTIAILPAGALIVGYGLRYAGVPRMDVRGRVLPIGAILAIVLTLWIVDTQLRMFYYFWFDKPAWKPAVEQLIVVRNPTEPTIINFADSSVIAYYNRHYAIQQGAMIHLAWRPWTPDEIAELMRVFDQTPSVWVVLRHDAPESWDTLAHLNATRTTGYRNSVADMLFYRFDQSDDESRLQFRFGDSLLLDGGIGHHLFARIGEPFCFDVPLIAQSDINGDYQVFIDLTQGYNTVRAQWHGVTGTHTAGEAFSLKPCIDIPPQSPRGPYHLRLAIAGADDERLPVLEGSSDMLRFWGYSFIMGIVSVDD